MKRSLHTFIVLFGVSLSLLLFSCAQEETPILPKNNKPVIEKLSSNKSAVLINGKVNLTCIAKDIDGDKLSIVWNSAQGFFKNGNTGPFITWTAPSRAGVDTIVVSVSDGKDTVTAKLIIVVGILPATPKLVDPQNGFTEISLSPILIWNRVKEAESYNVQLSVTPSFNKPIFNKVIKKSYRQIKNLQSNTIYYWRVQSVNEFGKSSWSKIFSFTTLAPPNKPVLESPFNNQKDVSVSPILSWSKIENADSITVEVANNKEFSNPIYIQNRMWLDNIKLEGLNFFSTYYWRIKAKNKYGESDWSEIGTFSTTGKAPDTPILIMPSNNSNNLPLSIEIKWNETEHASNYVLQVAKDSLFTDIVYNKDQIIKPSITITELENWTNYFWRVKSSNYYGVSEWSEVRSFYTIIAAPQINDSFKEMENIEMWATLNWNNVSGAQKYSIQIATDSSFANIVLDETGLAEPEKKLSGLNSFTKYYWRVGAQNSLGLSQWSNVNTFTSSGYFYRALPYGNQAVYNPIYVILNGGYDMIQVGNKRDIKNFPYNTALKNIWKNLSDPFGPINRYGWWDFIKDQVVPLSLNKDNGQFWPNYSLHLVGGGMEYAALKEWYEYYKYPYPGWLSALTVMSYHFVNEVVENGDRIGDDVDPIADFYLFDIGGIVLFTSESVKRFFAEDLNLSDWSQQPSFSLRNGELHNNGQFFSIKWKFPFLDSWYAFYYFGTNGVAGLSYKYKNGDALSVGFGLAAGDLILLNEKTNKKTLGLVGNLGLFYDRNNSLLASLSITIKTDYMVNLNIYPGVLKIGSLSPGLWGAYNQDGNYILGFTFSWLPFGAAYNTK